MLLNKEDLLFLCEQAKRAALAAGEIIRNVDFNELVIKNKKNYSSTVTKIVTDIDVRAEKAILNILRSTLSQYDLGILTEESIDDQSRLKKDYFWCIDPLDGTLAFSKQEEGYAVSIALVSQDGVPEIGVVYNPLKEDLYYSIKDNGAFKNKNLFTLSSSRDNLTFLCDYHQNGNVDLNKELRKIDGVNFLASGGAVMNALLTIELAPAVYIKRPKKKQGGGSLWDFAATSLIQAEARGHNSSFNGTRIDLNKKETTFMNKDGIIFSSSKELLSNLKL